MTESDARVPEGGTRTLQHAGVTVSYIAGGNGPPLVLVHGWFSDHHSNWDSVRPLLEPHFSLYAIARRGRGSTDATRGHSLADEARDVAAVIEAIGTSVVLLGHSHGGQVALAAAALRPEPIRKLILYEPPWPAGAQAIWPMLRDVARSGDWDAVATAFYRDVLGLPQGELDGFRVSELWPPIVQDAEATLQDIRALADHDFDPALYRGLSIPTLLQFGTHSPREGFVTDALHENLPDARLDEMKDEGHDAMMTSPAQYAESVRRFIQV